MNLIIFAGSAAQPRYLTKSGTIFFFLQKFTINQLYFLQDYILLCCKGNYDERLGKIKQRGKALWQKQDDEALVMELHFRFGDWRAHCAQHSIP